MAVYSSHLVWRERISEFAILCFLSSSSLSSSHVSSSSSVFVRYSSLISWKFEFKNISIYFSQFLTSLSPGSSSPSSPSSVSSQSSSSSSAVERSEAELRNTLLIYSFLQTAFSPVAAFVISVEIIILILQVSWKYWKVWCSILLCFPGVQLHQHPQFVQGVQGGKGKFTDY